MHHIVVCVCCCASTVCLNDVTYVHLWFSRKPKYSST